MSFEKFAAYHPRMRIPRVYTELANLEVQAHARDGPPAPHPQIQNDIILTPATFSLQMNVILYYTYSLLPSRMGEQSAPRVPSSFRGGKAKVEYHESSSERIGPSPPPYSSNQKASDSCSWCT